MGGRGEVVVTEGKRHVNGHGQMGSWAATANHSQSLPNFRENMQTVENR